MVGASQNCVQSHMRILLQLHHCCSRASGRDATSAGQDDDKDVETVQVGRVQATAKRHQLQCIVVSGLPWHMQTTNKSMI